MLIGKKYKVESEGLNVVLYRKVDKSKKDEAWATVGFHGSVASALKALVKLEVADTDLSDLRTVLNRINEVELMIDNALRNK